MHVVQIESVWEKRCNGTFPHKKNRIKKIMPNKWRTINSWVHKIDFTVDEGLGRLNPSRDRTLRQAPQKVEISCVAFLLCDPGWCVHKSDVQNKWDGNTHTHT